MSTVGVPILEMKVVVNIPQKVKYNLIMTEVYSCPQENIGIPYTSTIQLYNKPVIDRIRTKSLTDFEPIKFTCRGKVMKVRRPFVSNGVS